MRISVVQPPGTRAATKSSQDDGLAAGLELCRQSLAARPDILVFPEIWNVGFSDVDLPLQERLSFLDMLAVDGPSHPFVADHRQFARDHKVAIALGVLRKDGGRLFDSMFVIDAAGEILLTYDKVHTCDFDLEAHFETGRTFPTCTLETRSSRVEVGCLICYDREFPEAARLLMLAGAELILTANCCMLDDKRIHQFQARAFENATVMAMANYAEPLNGRSCVVHADGTFVAMGDANSGIVSAEIELDEIRAYRATCGWGNAFRRPQRYAGLSAEVDLPCFRRECSRDSALTPQTDT